MQCRFWLGNCFGYFFQKIGGIFFSLSGHPEETQSLGGADSILFCFSWLIFSFVVENFNCRNHNWAVQSKLDTEKKCFSCNFNHIFYQLHPWGLNYKKFFGTNCCRKVKCMPLSFTFTTKLFAVNLVTTLYKLDCLRELFIIAVTYCISAV